MAPLKCWTPPATLAILYVELYQEIILDLALSRGQLWGWGWHICPACHTAIAGYRMEAYSWQDTAGHGAIVGYRVIPGSARHYGPHSNMHPKTDHCFTAFTTASPQLFPSLTLDNRKKKTKGGIWVSDIRNYLATKLSYIRKGKYCPATPLLLCMLHSGYPTWIPKWSGLESSGPRLISLNRE